MRAAPRVTWPGRLVRGLRPDRNPLRRITDRIEAAVIAGLLTAFLAGAPLAAFAVGHWALADGLGTVRHQETAWRLVPAVLLQNPRPAVSQHYGGPPEVRARWTAPDRSRHTGDVAESGSARAGSTIMVWTDGSGRLTGPPLQRAQADSAAVLDAVIAVTVLAAVLLSIGVLARLALDRRRLAAWEAGWRATGPQWTSPR
ncbi:MAG: Rv1733c family protein [Streptosporangiaceae bacterium]